MITFFSTPKPFAGLSDLIQRNALRSWRRLHPDVEVILFGDDEGADVVAREFGLRHVPDVARNEFGTKRLDDMFAKAQILARNDLLCYINCDILLLPDFCAALERVKSRHERFLMVGRRWDMDITDPVDFSASAWSQTVGALARTKGVQQPGHAVDYFVFQRGLYPDMPPLVIGRIWWDHWLVWKAGREGADVVDVSECVLAVHQNHGYGYHPAGAKGVWTDRQAQLNFQVAGGRWHLHTIDDATHLLRRDGESHNWRRFWAPYWRVLRPRFVLLWFAILDATRPVRKLLGLRQKART